MSGSFSIMERFWEVIMGPAHPHLPREIPLITSLLYYSCAILLGRLFRTAVREVAPLRLRPYLFDAVTTFQVLACSLENGQVKKHYGHGAYGLALFSLWMWVYQTRPQGRANPCSYVIAVTRGTLPLGGFLARLACMLAGGLSSYQFARLFWSLQLTDSHTARYAATHCVSDLTVSVSLGFSVETLCTLLDTFLCLNTFSSFSVWEDVSKSVFGVILTIYGVHLTGMYLNPLNATNQSFGCDGTSAIEHFSVYWVGPLMAAAVATRTNDLLHGWGVPQKPASPTQKEANNNESVKNGGHNTPRNGRHTYSKKLDDLVKRSTEVTDDWVFVSPDTARSSSPKSKKTVTRRMLRNREVLIVD